jgi:multisubunit Na+/H+ antiporter MnhB subunit
VLLTIKDSHLTREHAMIRPFRTALYTAVTTVLLLVGGAATAFARPRPIEPEHLAPAGPAPAPIADAGQGDLRWLLVGVGVALALAAVGLALVLWHRAHAASPRFATP